MENNKGGGLRITNRTGARFNCACPLLYEVNGI